MLQIKQKLQYIYTNYMGTSLALIIQTRGCSAIKITKAGKNYFKFILLFELYLPLCIWVNRRRIYALACLTLASYTSATQKNAELVLILLLLLLLLLCLYMF